MSDWTYEDRLHIDVKGNSGTKFFTPSGVLVAEGYKRVVIGKRGPYVEFGPDNMRAEALEEPEAEHYYYIELRTVPDGVKVYAQVHEVDYADYKSGLFYISPFDLRDCGGFALIEPLSK